MAEAFGTLAEYYRNCPLAKPEPRQKTKARADRQESERDKKVRLYVFARERNVCRCCRKRAAESRHELRFRSLGGKVTRQNCVAVCGDGVQGCHGFLQRHEIAVAENGTPYDAERPLQFQARTRQAAEHLQIEPMQWIQSPLMVATEVE